MSASEGRQMDDDIGARVKLHRLSVLSDNHYILRKAEFAFRRRDGTWQDQARESYDPGGDGAAVLPIDRAHDRLLLVRQFRWPPFEKGYRKLMIEAPAGKLDGDDPETCAIREAMEEAGARIFNLRLAFHCFMSPGAVTERLSLFLADYDCTALRAKGGGQESEGEDIGVLEMSLNDALTMVARGEIADAKTILLIQAAVLERETSPSTSSR
jgi:nudix-type nucleoside diphosphatase (YffH/AdpP family)